MLCELCEVNDAAVTIIPVGEGLPQSVCSPCMARMGLALAKELLPAEEVASTLGPLFVNPAREDLHQEAEAQRKGRKTKAKAAPAEAEGEAGREAETPAAAENE